MTPDGDGRLALIPLAAISLRMAIRDGRAALALAAARRAEAETAQRLDALDARAARADRVKPRRAPTDRSAGEGAA